MNKNFLSLFLLISIFFVFGCKSPDISSPPNYKAPNIQNPGSNNGGSNIDDNAGAPAQPLSLSPSSASIAVGNEYSISPSGGTGSYSYSIVSGANVVSLSGNTVTAYAVGNAIINVSDSLSNVSLNISTKGADTLMVSGYTSCAKVSGDIQCFGREDHGVINPQAGVSATPIKVPQFTAMDIKKIVGGITYTYDSHYCVLTSGKTVRCWGSNSVGQLGGGTSGGHSQSTLVQALITNVKDIGAGTKHICALKEDKTVWCWGKNTYGELGNGLVDDTGTPTQVIGLPEIDKLSVGRDHVCAISTSGALYCWGTNYERELGVDTNETCSTLPCSTTPKLVIANSVQSVAAGRTHTCAVVSNKIKCWGQGNNGELGDGSNEIHRINTPTDINSAIDNFRSVAVGWYHSCGLTMTGSVVCWGMFDAQHETTEITPITGAILSVDQLLTGNTHTCIRKVSGEVRCWGEGVYSQLGTGDTNDREFATLIANWK